MTAFLESALFPNLLYLLLVSGIWLAALALLSPGTGVLELLAFIALVGAGLGTLVLPLNSWALVVLGIGVVFYVLSLRLEKFEIWLVLSALALGIGSAFLFRTTAPGPAVNPLLALAVSLLTLGYFWLAVRSSLQAQRERPSIDPSNVLGEIGEVRTDLDPTGSIYVAGELWTARADGNIKTGEKVRVIDREGLLLIVELAGQSNSDRS
ncbi:MAG: NfeD family protein [Anaerolineales bacterium]|jgi:membrane-bound serine protease (ClpP class)